MTIGLSQHKDMLNILEERLSHLNLFEASTDEVAALLHEGQGLKGYLNDDDAGYGDWLEQVLPWVKPPA